MPQPRSSTGAFFFGYPQQDYGDRRLYWPREEQLPVVAFHAFDFAEEDCVIARGVFGDYVARQLCQVLSSSGIPLDVQR